MRDAGKTERRSHCNIKRGEQWRRNHEASLRRETDRHYLNEFHKKNSEEAMRILSKQKPLSREEKEAQTERIHKAIDQIELHNKKDY